MDKTLYIAGPEPKHTLGFNDVALPNLFSRRLFCFALPDRSSHEAAVDAVQRSLQALISGLPALGGITTTVPAEEKNGGIPWGAIMPHNGIELTIKDKRSVLDFGKLEALGFPVDAFKDQELMPVPIAVQPDPQAICKLQMTMIQGGVLLAFCANHRLSDGNGMNSICAALREGCRLAGESQTPLAIPVLDTDQSIISSVAGTLTDISQHPAYAITPDTASPHSTATSNASGREQEHAATQELEKTKVVHAYRLEHDKAIALKAAAGIAGRISTHDAISALIWRVLIRARVKAGRLAGDETTSTFAVPHDARKHLGLPKAWIGNCVYQIVASCAVSDILPDENLPHLALAIRAQLNKVDRNVVGGWMEMKRRQPFNVEWWPIDLAHKSEVVITTSFYQSEMYGDWGQALGSVRHFTCSDEGAVGGLRQIGFAGPKLPGGAGCDVFLGLDEDELRHVRGDALWNRYFREVPSSRNLEEN